MWSYIQYQKGAQSVKNGTVRYQQKTGPDTEPLTTHTTANTGDIIEDHNESPGAMSREEDGPRNTASDDEDTVSNHNSDRIMVESTGNDDSLDPRNWSLWFRSRNIAVLALLIFVQAWAGASDSMANTRASKEFRVSKVAQNLSTALYLLGIGSGCLFVGPLAMTVGRNPTYLLSTFCYLFFVLGTALAKTFAGFVVCRYFIGLFASATLGINGASVKDQFRPVKRAFVFPIIAWANVVPPVLAPTVGGWIAESSNISWRWMEWVTLIISGFAFIIALLLLPETYFPVLLDWKAKHLRRATGDDRYFSEHESSSFTKQLNEIVPLSTKFAAEPVVAVLGAYLVLLYVLLFTFLSGFEYIFKNTYNLSDGFYGSCFASVAVGATLFTLGAPGLYSWARYRTEYIHGAPIEPEFRLWPAMVCAPLLPISLFWLGWTNSPHISIWSGLTACFVFGIVLIAFYVSSYEYIIDSYGDHATVALAIITMFRYMIAGGMVMAARPMFEGIGVHWTMTLLGCIAAVLTPGPYLLWRFGKTLRMSSPYAKKVNDF